MSPSKTDDRKVKATGRKLSGIGATEEQVTEAFKILIADKNVQAILVNIFGGIMKCDVIAQGIVNAARSVKLGVPLVVRLEGTNVDKGKQILKESGLSLIAADDLGDAAQTAVAAAANPKSQNPTPKEDSKPKKTKQEKHGKSPQERS